jgi:hypothetical protein
VDTNTTLTKLCRVCGVEKSINQFTQHPRYKGGIYYKCRPCNSEYKRNQYKNSRLNIKNWIFDYLLCNPCIDCGETNPLKLEFDHRGNKHFNIGKSFIGKAKDIEIVQSEIAKCDVRCSSCHRVKTHKEQNSWKYQIYLERNNQ